MLHRRPGSAETVTRFCLSSLGTIACWALWIVLGLLLAAQVWVLVAHELPVPKFVLGLIEKRLAQANLDATFARAQFDPTGKFLAENVGVRSRQFDDPLLLGRSLYVRKSIWSYLSGQRAPDEIRLEGGTLQLPALLSPSGTAEPVLREISAALRLDRHRLHVDQLNFRAGNLIVSVRGELLLPARGAAPPDPARIVAQALQQARRIVRELPRLDAFDHPALDVVLEARPGVGNVADLRFSAETFQLGGVWPTLARGLHARTTLRLDGKDARPLRVSFVAEEVSVRDQIQTQSLRGVVATEIVPTFAEPPRAALVLLAAQRVAAFDEEVVAPVCRIAWRQERPVQVTLGVRAHEAAFALSSAIDVSSESARLTFDGRVPPSLVDAVLPRRAPKLAPYFVFDDPVDVHAEVAIGEGWRFETLQSRVRALRLNSRGVPVTHARGRIDVDRAGNFLAHDAVARLGENFARGSYFMNFRSWDYRFLLTGALHPPAIAGWFRSDWWTKFWATNFEFPGPPPGADVDVIGNWRNAAKTAYYGSTDAVSAKVLGAGFERAHAIVFVRPHFAHAFDLRVERAGGAQRARGWFKRYADPATREQRRLEFDLAGNLDPDTQRHLGREVAATLLQPWTFDRPPEIHFWGASDYADGKSVPDLRFAGSASGRVTYDGFPLESVEAEGIAVGPEVRLDRILIGVAGGRGTAKASYASADGARRLGFDFYIENADMVRAIRAMHEYSVAHGGTEPNASPNKELLQRASGGKLQFAVSASGNPDDLKTFVGSGNVQLAGAELGEVHLFGLLSQVLSSLSLNFSSLKLDTLRASYQVANGVAHFPDVRVTGPTALIEAKGDYRLVDRTLDFTAKFKPYDENRNPLTFVVGIVVNPLASILDLRLTGPIQKPNWSLSLLGGGGAKTPAAPAPQSTPATPESTPAESKPAEPPKAPRGT